MNITPFRISIDQTALDDLRYRLLRTRWPHEIRGSKWEYGTDLSYMKNLVRYWLENFDWRKQEEELNQFAQYKADVDGLSIHYIHERGRGPNPIPLIITHGWPGTFAEMLKIIPRLTDTFDVIVPSIPGYGFSESSSEPGLNTFQIAEKWNKLMLGLGYKRYGGQGGDWGANITTVLALRYPENMIGIHLNYIPGSYAPFTGTGTRPLSAAEIQFVKDADRWWNEEGAYGHLQRTTPQTLAYAVNDSPAGLAAWIIEKFRSWSDCDGRLETRFTTDELLTNICLYWFTESKMEKIR